MMDFINLEIKDKVGIVTLNRPDKLNAFNRGMALELQQCLDDLAENNSVWAIMLIGSGKAFCAGQDIEELVGDNGLAVEKILKEHFNPIVTRIRNIGKPVVAAVNGVAAGAGANIALCCDLVVAAESASFIQAFTKIGLIPDSGGTYFLPRLIGFQQASALMLLGDKVVAKEAESMGMVYKVFEDGSFVAEAIGIAQKLAQLPPQALAYTKHALNVSMQTDLINQLSVEDDYQKKAAETTDHKEGMTAFLEKRKPNFTGK